MSSKDINQFRVIFMEDHITIRTDRSLLLGRQTSKWSLWYVVFHENNSTLCWDSISHTIPQSSQKAFTIRVKLDNIAFYF